MATFNGNARNNTLRGGPEDDAIFGLDGDDTLLGRSGNDRLEGGRGDDLLDGGKGADQLIGGEGNDTYVVTEGGDRITESAKQGGDTVQCSIRWTLGSGLENLTLTSNQAVNGTGNKLNNVLVGNKANNTLSGLEDNDRLSGGGGNDRLDGGTGSDILIGGTGNDTYVVDQSGDRITETSAQGTDTVEVSTDFTLPGSLENLTLKGNAVRGTGNSLANKIIGNETKNTLRGSGGADSLTGNAGNDTLVGGSDVDFFIYQTGTAFRRSDIGLDTITDFSRQDTDAIVLSRQTFGLSSAIDIGFSVATEFQSVGNNSQAENSPARIVFSRRTGTLFYNPNGASGGFGSAGESGSFAVLKGGTSLAATDFLIEA